jgi:hypothetical protein
MLNLLNVAQLEYREQLRDFNVRAARGEFVRYEDDRLASAGSVRWSDRLGRAVRNLFSRGRSLVIDPRVDSA